MLDQRRSTAIQFTWEKLNFGGKIHESVLLQLCSQLVGLGVCASTIPHGSPRNKWDGKSGVTNSPEQTGAKIFNVSVLNTAVSNPPLQTCISAGSVLNKKELLWFLYNKIKVLVNRCWSNASLKIRNLKGDW